jgi:hypothetical protein
MEKSEKEYHCEDCQFFNEESIPAECMKGNGKVAFRHPICSYFKLRIDNNLKEGE